MRSSASHCAPGASGPEPGRSPTSIEAMAVPWATLVAASRATKFFRVIRAETTRLNRLIAAGRRETAAFDELGLRRRAV